MSSRPTAAPTSTKSGFHTQRDALVADIALALEHVLQNMNKLNRSLEGVIAVGNEFGAVEALWSQFEGVMAQPPAQEGGEKKEPGEDGEGEGREENGEGERNGEGRDEGQAREGRTSRRGR